MKELLRVISRMRDESDWTSGERQMFDVSAFAKAMARQVIFDVKA